MTESTDAAKLPPDRLYKYRSMPPVGSNEEAWRRMEFVSGQLWFAPPNMLNDPFDCRPVLVLDASTATIETYLQKADARNLGHLPRRGQHELKEIVRRRLRDPDFNFKLLRENADRFGVYSMSEAPDQPLMWAHYAGAHLGYCLELRFEPRDWDPVGCPEPVTYAARRPEMSQDALLRMLSRDSATPSEREDFVRRMFLKKSDDWAYEREWRVVRSPSEDGPGVVSTRPEIVSGVVLGSLASDEDVARLRQWASKRRAPLRWFRAVPARRDYSLDIQSM